MNTTRWEKYIEASLRTEKDRTPEGYLAHGVCFVGELGELVDESDEERRLREAGDVWWYLAVLAHGVSEVRGHPNQLRPSLDGPYGDNIWRSSSVLVEMIEDVAFQDGRASVNWYWSVQSLFSEVTAWLSAKSEVETKEIWNENIEKLAERHDV